MPIGGCRGSSADELVVVALDLLPADRCERSCAKQLEEVSLELRVIAVRAAFAGVSVR